MSQIAISGATMLNHLATHMRHLILQVRNLGLQGAVLKQAEALKISKLHSVVLRDCSLEGSLMELISPKVTTDSDDPKLI